MRLFVARKSAFGRLSWLESRNANKIGSQAKPKRGFDVKRQQPISNMHGKFVLPSNKKATPRFKAVAYVSIVLRYFIGTSFSIPPIYLRSTSGMVTEPSAFWFCSKIAGNTRLVAKPLALSVCINSNLLSQSRL